MANKTYKKSAIIAALKNKILEAKAAYTRAAETVREGLSEDLATYTGELAQSGFTKIPAPIHRTVKLPPQGYVEGLERQVVQLEAQSDVPEIEDSVILDEADANNILTGDIPLNNITFRITA